LSRGSRSRYLGSGPRGGCKGGKINVPLKLHVCNSFAAFRLDFGDLLVIAFAAFCLDFGNVLEAVVSPCRDGGLVFCTSRFWSSRFPGERGRRMQASRRGLRKNTSRTTARMATWDCYSRRNDTKLYMAYDWIMLLPFDQNADASRLRACQDMMSSWEMLGTARDDSCIGSAPAPHTLAWYAILSRAGVEEQEQVLRSRSRY